MAEGFAAMRNPSLSLDGLITENQMEWVRQMNSIRNRAEEIILDELIYN